MANPCFRKNDGSDAYVWAELSHIPSERGDLTSLKTRQNAVINFSRNRYVFHRYLIDTKGNWNLFWRSIPLSMVISLQTFFEEDYFFFFPDYDESQYWSVYIANDTFSPVLLSNGQYDLSLTLKEYGVGSLSFSSSSSSSSSIGINLLVSSDVTANRIYFHQPTTGVRTNSFASQDEAPSGLGYDDGVGNLLECDSYTDRFYIHSGIVYALSNSFASPNINPYALDYMLGHYISLDNNTDLIYVHVGKTQSISFTFSTPAGDPTGLATDQQNIITCDRTTDFIYFHSGESAVIDSSFQVSSTTFHGLAYNGDTFVCQLSRIYRYSSKTSTLINSFSAGGTNTQGLTFIR
jgi:hypothetical protein